jgi:ribose 5-phosphate isomerase A
MQLAPADEAKRAAAARALEMVEDGMVLGLGTGSTAGWFVRLLADRLRQPGLSVEGVATSSATVWLAEELGVPLRRLEDVPGIDLVVDGADELDAKLNLIKGGGAALLQEKIVASASARMVVIADESKRVAHLGAFPLPVEIVRFGWTVTRRQVSELLAAVDVDGRQVSVRMGADGPLVTDEGNFILDLHLGRIGDPPTLASELNALPGVVESGLFIDMAHCAIIGRADGTAEVLYRPGARRADPMDIAELMRNQDA